MQKKHRKTWITCTFIAHSLRKFGSLSISWAYAWCLISLPVGNLVYANLLGNNKKSKRESFRETFCKMKWIYMASKK